MGICAACQINTSVTIEAYLDKRNNRSGPGHNLCFPCRVARGLSHLKPLVFVYDKKEDPVESPSLLDDESK